MSMNKYVRPRLSATIDRIADPVIEVGRWLDLLRTILDGATRSRPAHDAYDLLALLGKLERVRSEIIQELNGQATVAEARDRLTREAVQLLDEALKIHHVQGWLEQAELLRTSYEGQPMDADEQYKLAETVLFDLDDAELVVLMAHRAGLDNEKFYRDLQGCREWVRQQADFFVPASVRVQAVGKALRSDLEMADPALARTAEKFAWILDAIEDAEARWTFEGQPPMSASEIRTLVESYWNPRPPIISFRDLLANRAKPSLIAAQGAGIAPIDRSCVWQSPDRRFWAELRIPYLEPREGGEVFSLAFYRKENDEPATELAGGPVTLAGVTVAIDCHAVARFTRKAIEDGQARLVVGEPGEPWQPLRP